MMMHQGPPPIVSDLVLIGGGHSHVHLLKMFGMPKYRQWVIDNGIRITLIAKDVHTPYSGMLPGFVAGHYTYDEIHLDLEKLCKFSNTILIHAAATEIVSNGNGGIAGGFIKCNDGRPPIRYDALSIDIGSAPSAISTTATSATSAATKSNNNNKTNLSSNWIHHPRIIPVKPIANFCKYYERLQEKFKTMANSNKNSQQSTNQPNNGALTKMKRRKHRVCIVGGGAGGIELALSVQYNLQQIIKSKPQQQEQAQRQEQVQEGLIELEMILVTRGNSLLKEHNAGVQKIFQRILKERNIQIYYGCDVIGVQEEENKQEEDGVGDDEETKRYQLIVKNKVGDKRTDSGTGKILFDDCLWCTSAQGSTWLSSATPFECTERGGFVKVDDTLQVLNYPGIFAAGDCCHMINHPRPKAGVFAVRAGPPLLENLVAYLSNKRLRPYRPQSNFLGLISTGDTYAIASKGKYFCLEASWLWTVKDWIDRTWMAKYTSDIPDIQEMMIKNPPKFPLPSTAGNVPGSVLHKQSTASGSGILEAFASDPMRCGGCGAKVGSTSLSRVLKALHRRQIYRAKHVLGITNEKDLPPPIDHDDAAIVPLRTGFNSNNATARAAAGGAMIHTIDYFRSLVDDPYIFGKIVAVHALSDIHAMGVTAQSALTLAVIPFAADEAIVESTLLQLLSGVSDILQDENVLMVGGHTCEGMELACGLAINGYVPGGNNNDDDYKKYILRKRGGKVGDKIILTKPIGTGALFASDMRGKCKGEYVIEALSYMQQSNVHCSRVISDVHQEAIRSKQQRDARKAKEIAKEQKAAQVASSLLFFGGSGDDDDDDVNKNNNIGTDKNKTMKSTSNNGTNGSRPHNTHDDSPSPIHACTDVTGFGLMGHLLEMLMANDDDDVHDDSTLQSIGAKIDIRNVPFLRGGIDASEQGIYSSLQSQNLRTRRTVKNHVQVAKDMSVEYPLLFDPQTSGGLLIFVDKDYVESTPSFLRNLQEQSNGMACIIGELTSHDDDNKKNKNITSNNVTTIDDDDDLFVCTVGNGNAGKRIEIIY